MKKIPFYFSIDFEDSFHDVQRAIGHKSPGNKEVALYQSYEKIKYICKSYFNNKKISFFVTGILARQFPDLIKQIFNDGHEIGSHYNFHDRVSLSNRRDFANNLDISIKSIEKAIGEKPLGFRAPFFGIENHNLWAYEELAKRFAYDSSFRTSKPISKLKKFKDFEYKDFKLKEFFVYGKPILNTKFSIRTGGTFLRLFSANKTINIMKESFHRGHVPILYLHPYELLLNHDFWLNWKDLEPLKTHKKTYYWLRQMQWSHLGHKSVENKIKKISNEFVHVGPMKLLLN